MKNAPKWAFWESKKTHLFTLLDYNRFAMATVTLPTEIQLRSPKGGFANEPFVDFKAQDNARNMKNALDLVACQLGREYDLLDRKSVV